MQETKHTSQAGERTLTDDEIIERHDQGVMRRARTELEITHALIKALRKDGYEVRIQVDDRRGVCGSEQELVSLAFEYDEAIVMTRRTGARNSFVQLIFGNGAECISDYGMSLEPTMKPLGDWIDAMEETGKF